jgi:hypothetical protein
MGAAALEAAIRSLRPHQLANEIAIGTFKTTVANLIIESRSHVVEHDATIRASAVGRPRS